MACELTTGFALDCKEGVGGVKEFLVQQWADFNGGITFDGTTGQIETLPTATLYRYELKGSGNSFVQTPTVSDDNGTVFFEQVLTVNLFQLTYQKRKELTNLIKNYRLAIFVRDMNDNIFMMGRTDGAYVSGGTATTGAAKGDLNGYTLTFTAQEAVLAEHLETFTTYPFDNFPGITVSPAYVIAS